MYRVADLAITGDRPMESLLVVHSPSSLSDYGCQVALIPLKPCAINLVWVGVDLSIPKVGRNR